MKSNQRLIKCEICGYEKLISGNNRYTCSVRCSTRRHTYLTNFRNVRRNISWGDYLELRLKGLTLRDYDKSL